ncbi:MAG TPA: hypothetical protein VGU45_04815, partial [Microvirga sp.]|nr:hypothetical protein [Microvirga sp.]
MTSPDLIRGGHDGSSARSGKLDRSSAASQESAAETTRGSLPMKSHFAMMAGYNAWSNERIYDV